jgi:hypothetical protein
VSCGCAVYIARGPSSIPNGDKFLISSYRLDRLWSPLSLLSDGFCVFFALRVRRLGREAYYSPPTSVEVKKTWLYTSIDPCSSTLKMSMQNSLPLMQEHRKALSLDHYLTTLHCRPTNLTINYISNLCRRHSNNSHRHWSSHRFKQTTNQLTSNKKLACKMENESQWI